MPLPSPLFLLALAAPATDLEAKVKAIFEDQCTACHGSGGEFPNLEDPPSRLASLKSKATGKALVAAGNPDGSYLLAKIVGKGIEGDPMPQGGDPLPAGQKKTIKDWIASLAPAAPPAAPAATPTPAAGGGASSEDAAKRVKELEPKVKKIFEDQCNACHDAGGDEVVLSGPLEHLTKESSKTGGKFFIAPGDPDNSYVYIKVVGGPAMKGDRMPQGGDPLPKTDTEILRQYIVALGDRDKPAGGGGGDVPPPDAGGSVDVAPDPVPDGGGGGDEDGGEKKKGRAPFYGVFQVNLPTTASLGRRTFEFRIDHRFGAVGQERGAFGLDAGANISYGFAYGILDGWDVLLRRSNSRKGYELGTKYIPVRQEAGYPVSFGGYASLEYYRDFPTNTANPWSGNFQLMLSRLWFDRWSTMLTVGYHLRTNHRVGPQVDLEGDDVDGPVKVRDKRGTLGVGLASTVWIGAKKKWGIDMEYHLPIPVNAFYFNGGNADPNGSNIGSWSIGGSVRTGLHFFQIFITNTREIHTNLYAPGGQSKNPFENRGNFFFGFNLSRKWSL
jgi:mono/diheme cytochrome c family protein